MGLLKKANNFLTDENLQNESEFSTKKKAENDSEKNKLFAFFDFLKKYDVSSFAICQSSGDFFTIKDSLGFDGKTILRFKISRSDCASLFGENKNIVAINVDNFDFLSNIFSDAQKDKNPEFSFCKINDNFLIICDRKITDSALKDFFNIDNRQNVDLDSIKKKFSQNYNAYAVEIDFQKAIETFVRACPDKKIENETLFSSIFAEICNRFFYFYNLPQFSKRSGDYILKTCFFAKEKFPDEILINHIIYNLKEILENSAEIINVAIKETKNFSEVQDFYKAE